MAPGSVLKLLRRWCWHFLFGETRPKSGEDKPIVPSIAAAPFATERNGEPHVLATFLSRPNEKRDEFSKAKSFFLDVARFIL
jgi:hypothetical protein